MSTCNICGKQAETAEPMVLVGNKCFLEGAGNGRAWVGQAPSIRYWKTFALLSISICPECLSKEQHKLTNRLLHKHPTIGNLALSHYLKAKKIPREDILALPGEAPGAPHEDIDMKATMMISDPWLGSNFKYLYELSLFTKEELPAIGNLEFGPFDGDAWKYAPNQGLEEAQAAAAALFQTIR